MFKAVPESPAKALGVAGPVHNGQSQGRGWPLVVLARRIGKPRPFALVLLLYVATFGIYGIYWHYRAHHEVHRQFELDLEGRDEGVVWLILDRVFFALRWIFQYGFVGNVAHVRRRMGEERGVSPAAFLGLAIPGSALTYIGLILAFASTTFTNEAGAVTDRFWFTLLLSIGLGAYVLGAALQIPAYGLLQRDLNRIWRGYDVRIAELMPPYPAAAAPSAPSLQTWRQVPAASADPEWRA